MKIKSVFSFALCSLIRNFVFDEGTTARNIAKENLLFLLLFARLFVTLQANHFFTLWKNISYQRENTALPPSTLW